MDGPLRRRWRSQRGAVLATATIWGRRPGRIVDTQHMHVIRHGLSVDMTCCTGLGFLAIDRCGPLLLEVQHRQQNREGIGEAFKDFSDRVGVTKSGSGVLHTWKGRTGRKRFLGTCTSGRARRCSLRFPAQSGWCCNQCLVDELDHYHRL